MMLRGRGLLKPSECLAKTSYKCYSGWKRLIHSSSCSIYGIWWEGLVDNVMWERGWLETSDYHHMERGSLKLLKKRHMIFERNLIPNFYNCIGHPAQQLTAVVCLVQGSVCWIYHRDTFGKSKLFRVPVPIVRSTVVGSISPQKQDF